MQQPLTITYDKDEQLFTITDRWQKTIKVSLYAMINFHSQAYSSPAFGRRYRVSWRNGFVQVSSREIGAAERQIRGCAADALEQASQPPPT
jgi:hypothetical protein